MPNNAYESFTLNRRVQKNSRQICMNHSFIHKSVAIYYSMLFLAICLKLRNLKNFCGKWAGLTISLKKWLQVVDVIQKGAAAVARPGTARQVCFGGVSCVPNRKFFQKHICVIFITLQHYSKHRCKPIQRFLARQQPLTPALYDIHHLQQYFEIYC